MGSKKRDDPSKTPLNQECLTHPPPVLLLYLLTLKHRKFHTLLPNAGHSHNHLPENDRPTNPSLNFNTFFALKTSASGEDTPPISPRTLIHYSRLTHMNERLERELSELRAIINASPASDTSSILFSRSPALPSPALPAVSPSGFSVRSSGERDMEISSTPLHLPSTLPDEEDNDRNHLSDFDFFLGQSQPPVANNSSMNAEPSGSDPIHPNSQEGGNNCSTNRPSSAPPDIDDTRPSVLLSPFQPSASLPPRSKSVEPRSRYQERMLQIQRELDIVNEDLASKNKDLNELRELASRLKDQVI